MIKLTGNGRPTPHTKGELGQFYQDLTTGDIYECRVSSEFSKLHGAPIGGYQWELRATGENIEEHAVFYEGEWELIERIITGYEILEEEPEDWAENRTSYFMLASGTIQPYAYEDFYPGYALKYVGDGGTTKLTRTACPDGTPYNFDAMHFDMIVAGGKNASSGVSYYTNSERESEKILVQLSASTSNPYAANRIWKERGVWESKLFAYASSDQSSTTIQDAGRWMRMVSASAPNNKIWKTEFAMAIPEGVKIDIWAVK